MKIETKEIYNKLDKMPEEQLDKLFDILGIGIPQDLDKGEKIMIIGTEPVNKIKKALKKLK